MTRITPPRTLHDPLAAKIAEINAAFERAMPNRRPDAWVPQGPWNGLADEMSAAKERAEIDAELLGSEAVVRAQARAA